MESSRFDDLAKTLATATSRRQALKAIAATTLGSFLGLSGIGNVFAKPCTPNGKHCNSNTVCCSGFCDSATRKCACPPGTCSSACPCPSGQTCVNGQCTCPSGCLALANGTCAQICTGVPDSCTCGGSSGSVCAGDSSSPTGGVCSPNGAVNTGTCTSDANCPPGYFCNTNFGPPATCFPACC
jgi:hypothetical protein